MTAREREELLNEFLSKWTKESVQNMILDEYVVGENNQTFCYWVETETKLLGNIKGQNSFIFGIYKRKEKLKEHIGNYKTDGEYSWLTKFGDKRDEVFENVKNEILQIIEYSETGKFYLIENLKLHPFFKWKVAYLYSNKRIIPIYEKRVLHNIAEYYGLKVTDKTKIFEIQDLMIQNKPSYLDFYEFTDFLWQNFSKESIDRDNIEIVISDKLRTRKPTELKNIEPQIRKYFSRTTNVEQLHNRIQNALKAKLEKKYGKENVVLLEENDVDVKLFEPDQIVFYEVKSSSDPSECIRQAIGQLLRYYFVDKDSRKKKLVVVGQYPPNQSDKEFIEFIKSNLNIDFDYENIELE
ncbi:MAG TPA: hypothetical protein PKE69_25085 [Pyrinomonadaceae bacterium]|nr:hypothetical protein [Pyrinomonadaceae bacterium]